MPQDDDWIWRGLVFAYSVDQAVVILESKASGRVLGPAAEPSCYIIMLDQPLPGARAIIVHEDNMCLVDCYWCRDKQQVSVTPLTGAQLKAGDIPTKPCPYCTEKEMVNG